MTSSPKVWKSIEALICWTPPRRRESTKSRTTRVSGADHAAAPRKSSLPADVLDPLQQPHCQPQLRLRSVPTFGDPALGWRFLRQDAYAPVATSYSAPSGLT